MWQLALLPATDKEIVKFVMERWTPMLPDFWWDAVNSCCFTTLELFYGYTKFYEGGWFIELLFGWELRNTFSGRGLYRAVSNEEGLEVLGPASEDGGVVGEEVLSV